VELSVHRSLKGRKQWSNGRKRRNHALLLQFDGGKVSTQLNVPAGNVGRNGAFQLCTDSKTCNGPCNFDGGKVAMQLNDPASNIGQNGALQIRNEGLAHKSANSAMLTVLQPGVLMQLCSQLQLQQSGQGEHVSRSCAKT